MAWIKYDLWKALIGDGVNIYLYGVDNASSLQLGSSFTGNFKGWIAGTSSTGVNPDLLAVIDDTWQDTADLDNPIWNKFSGDVVDLTYIVDSTFVGYVPMYAKDDVWIAVNMGAPDPRWVWNFNGMSYGVIPEASIGTVGSVTLLCRFTNNTGDDRYLTDGATGRPVVNHKAGNVFGVTSGLVVEIDGVAVVGGDSVPIDGDTHTVKISSTVAGMFITHIGSRYTGSLAYRGDILQVSGDGLLNTDIYASGTFNFGMDKPYSDPYFFTDSDNGVIMSTFNVLPADVTQEAP